MFETCQIHYNLIKKINVKSVYFVGSYHLGTHNIRIYVSWTASLGGYKICRIILKWMQQKQILKSIIWSELVRDDTQVTSALNSILT
jgi:hypothetical protein